MIAYHGGAAIFDRFDAGFIKTGQGCLTFGWGVYLAESREVASGYRDLYAGRTAFLVEGREVCVAGRHDPTSRAIWSLARLGLEVSRRHVQQLKDTDGINTQWVAEFERVVEELSSSRVECIESGGGALYEARIPDGEVYLDWDLSLTDQSDFVKSRLGVRLADVTLEEVPVDKPWAERQWLASNGWSVVLDGRRYRVYDQSGGFLGEKGDLGSALEHIKRLCGDNTGGRGSALYADLVLRLGSQRLASEHLAGLGIKGVRYFDGYSRGSGQGSRNYVVFDVTDVEVLSVNGRPVASMRGGPDRGMFDRSTGAMVFLESADASTIVHESAHLFFEHDLALVRLILNKHKAAERTPEQVALLRDVSTLLSWCGIDGSIEEQIAAWDGLDLAEQGVLHEDVADAFEVYCMRGACPHPKLKGVFSSLAQWMSGVYSSVKDFIAKRPRGGDLNEAVCRVFDRMVVADEFGAGIELGEQGQLLYEQFVDQAMKTGRFAQGQCEAHARILASHYVGRARQCQMEVQECFEIMPASLHAQALNLVDRVVNLPLAKPDHGEADRRPENAQVVAQEACTEALARRPLSEPSRALALPGMSVARELIDAAPVPEAASDHVVIDGIRRATRNDRGQLIASDLAQLAAFWRWFGNGEFIDDAGRPRVFYTGRRRVSKPDAFVSRYGRATPSFTLDPAVASVYARQVETKSYGTGSNVMPVYLGSKSVLDLRGLGSRFSLEDVVMLLPRVDLESDRVSHGVGYRDLADSLKGLDVLRERVDAWAEFRGADALGYPLESFSEVRQRIEALGEDGDISGLMDLLAGVRLESFLLADGPGFSRMLVDLKFDAVIHLDAFVIGQEHYEGDRSALGSDGGGQCCVDTFRPLRQVDIKSAMGNTGSYRVDSDNILMQSAVDSAWPRFLA